MSRRITLATTSFALALALAWFLQCLARCCHRAFGKWHRWEASRSTTFRTD